MKKLYIEDEGGEGEDSVKSKYDTVMLNIGDIHFEFK